MIDQSRQLRRQNAWVVGVCGGLGAFTGANPWVFRILFLFFMLPGGVPGILLYVILWIVIPRKSVLPS